MSPSGASPMGVIRRLQAADLVNEQRLPSIMQVDREDDAVAQGGSEAKP
ncbi:hypothetical protein [Bradyrhizobium sp.]